MEKQRTTARAEDRSVSELVGVVLLFGIVIAGSAMLFVSGAAVTEDVRERSHVDAAEMAFASVDGTVQSLAQKQGSTSKPVDVGPVDPNNAEIRESGEIRVQINGNAACIATMELSALEYESDGGTTIAYEGGAIWKRNGDDVSAEKSPDIGFRNGSLQLEVVRLEGSVENDEMTVDYDRAESIEQTNDVREQLFAEESCRRPDTITITVQSDYHEGWERQLESHLPDDATVTSTGPETVTAHVDLDAAYDVVDFGESSRPGEVVDAGPAGDVVRMDAADGDHRYDGTVTFLGGENARFSTDTVSEETEEVREITLEYSEDVELEMSGTTTVTVVDEYWEWDNETVEVPGEEQPPLEVEFVIDESGSMQWGGKMADARSATKGFLDVMKDDQGHRVSLVGYDYCTNEYYSRWSNQWRCGEIGLDVTTYQPFTTDQDAASDALSELQVGGGTPIPQAIEQASDQFREDGSDEHDKVLVLVTDGKNTADGDPVETAREEIPDGVTVYTIGVGSEVNDDVLEKVAQAGDEDSQYIKVENADELDETFERIAKDETTEEREVGNKVKTTETRTVEVPVPLDEDEVVKTVTAERTLTTSDPEMPGDEVTLSKEYSISHTARYDGEVVVERTIDGINETTTETVTKTVSGEVTETKSGEIEGEVEVSDRRTETVEEDSEVSVVSWPALSMALSNGETSTDLWAGQNVNAPSSAVESGSYANFWVDGDGEVEFRPTFRACSDHTRTDDVIEDDGTEYAQATCATYGSAIDRSSTVHVFANESTIDVPASADWQEDLGSMLTVDGEQYYTYEGGEMKAWNLDSNQVLVIVEAEDGAGRDANNVVLLVEIGESSSEASAEHLVNIEVTSVSADDDDEDD